MVMDRAALAALVLLAALTPLTGAGEQRPADDFTPSGDLAPGWYARVETSKGRIIVRLLTRQSPQSVAHFAALAEGRLEWSDPITGETIKERFYDGGQIHRAVAASRIEAGRRSGTGRPAPLIYVPEEPTVPVSFAGGLRLGLARVGPRISAAEFFITASAQRGLDGRFNCVGEVVRGDEVVFQLSQVKTYPGGRPIDPLVIDKVDLFAVGNPAPLPEPKPYEHRTIKFQKAEGGGR